MLVYQRILNVHVLETIPTQTEIEIVQQKIGKFIKQKLSKRNCCPTDIGIHYINGLV